MFAHSKTVRQVAALPFVVTDDGVEVLLITSRRRGRWIVPKGWPMDGRSLAEAARLEARQEAGVIGRIGGEPLGSYRYRKRMRAGYEIPATVFLYPLVVDLHRTKWRERGERRTAWHPIAAAARIVDDRGLARLIESLARRRGAKLKRLAERLAVEPHTMVEQPA